MAPSSNLFNTGTVAVFVSFNRGKFILINGAPPPGFAPQPGFPAPPWNPGGPPFPLGNIGPGANSIQMQTSGYILPPVDVTLPNISPGSIQTYLIWSLDPQTLAATLGVMFLSSGQIIGYDSVSGTATPAASP
jgi:hypothetical protein